MGESIVSDEPGQQRCEVYYSGRVQGVGFRYTARRIAAHYRVTGFVKNLPDGRVHLVAEGPEEQVALLLARIRDTMERYLVNVHETWAPATGRFAAFEIQF
jgi:acylphosphatase